MCDTVALVPDDGPVWFGKNSDREPSEPQFLELHDRFDRSGAPEGLGAEPSQTRVLLSRPGWMWGAEIGANEHGLAIGNEAVFTRLPVPKQGVSGMDFLRVALHRCRTAVDAVDQLIELTERFAQGGRMGHRSRSFRYNSSFLIADRRSAWVFETAGQLWAAKRVRGVATISNALTIEDDFDRVHTGAYEIARRRGWVKSAQAFSFAGAFSDPIVSALSGAGARRACTARALRGISTPRARDFVRALSDHGGHEPTKGWRGESPCAHASWFPTRNAQQTTASWIARLDDTGPSVWATGTSSPCLSAFKPAPLDASLFPPGPIEDTGFDHRALWWAHERLHRVCLRDYHARRISFAEDRERFQDECLAPGADAAQAWRAHQRLVDEWRARASAVEPSRTPLPTRLYWTRQSRASAIPGELSGCGRAASR